MGEVPTGGQVKAHDAVVGLKEAGVDSEVGWGAGVRLNVHTPFLRVEAVSLEGPLLAENLDLVHDIVTAVVAGSGKTLGVLVGKCGTKAVNDSLGGEVLRSNELEAPPLSVLLPLNQVEHDRIVLG